jgi:dipeptidyl aminopeptidase/acylaminoacyl peptidase
MARWFMTTLLVTLVLLLPLSLPAQQKHKGGKQKEDTEITLERLFPEDGLFGPQASGAAFSTDGKYAAWLYRTYDERRHGNDLWLYEFASGQLTRVTDVATMSEFQRSARKVGRDRLDKHAKAEKKKADKQQDGKDSKSSDDGQSGQQEGDGSTSDEDAGQKKEKSKEQLEEERRIMNTVTGEDADDEDAPRYSGIAGFEWHPRENSMLVFSEGDVYQIADLQTPVLQRLTCTEARESQVNYLPDGSGYTYNLDNVLYCVRFDDHRVRQLNPRLPAGMELSGYSLSEDGRHLVITGRSGRRPEGGRQVDIIRYRDRFAKADSVPRTVSDDETKPRDLQVWLYDLQTAEREESDLIRIFQTRIDDPRDVISQPQWSPDSSKVTFCFFDQENSEVQIRTGEFPDPDKLAELREEAEKKQAREEAKQEEEEDQDEQDRGGRRGRRGGSREAPLTLDHEARIVYRFKHDGGPNTPRMVSPDWAWDNRHVVFVSEQSGFRHVHLLDPLYESVRQLTAGHFEVYPLRLSEDHRTLFLTATRDSAARTMAYALDLESAKLTRISDRDGSYSGVAVSDDGKRLLANFVSYGTLPELICQNGSGKVETLTDSHPEETRQLTQWEPEFFDYSNRHGHTIHGMMFKPPGWKKSAGKKYPLLIYVYGGPLGTRKSVTDGSYRADGYFFQAYMAHKHGYLTVVIDPRGQSGYGGFFEKANYEQVGKPQVEDLVDGVRFLTENYNIDDQRVGIHGWSFGGFQTQMCLYTEPDVFQVGLAGAGPTEWENYNAWYTTGTVGPSRTGKPDQKKYSLLPLAKNLKGKLLLVHGIEDTNVLFQDTVAIYRELLQAGKETNVELFVDPTGGHGLGGDVKRLNRMRKYEEFLLRTLGSAAGDKS